MGAQGVPKAPLSAASYYLLSKWVRVLLSLIFVPKIRPMKTVSTGQVFSRFPGRLLRGFLGTFFPLLFPPVLQLLSSSMPLFGWAGHQLSTSESCV